MLAVVLGAVAALASTAAATPPPVDPAVLWTKLDVPLPAFCPRYGHEVYAQASDRLIVFVNGNRDGNVNEVWC